MIIKSEFANENYDEYELAVICYLSQFKKEKTQIYLSAKTILKDLIASTYTRCEYENICKAINKLIQKQILIQYNFDKEGVYVNFEKAYPSKNDFYFELTLKDILTILQSENKNKYLTLKVFATILSNFASNISVIVDNNTKKRVICQMSQNFLAWKSGCSEVTLIKHIKTLEELHLLYVLRDYSNIDDTSGYKRNNNIYCRYEDKAYAIAYASSSRGHLLYKKKNEQINKKRSVTQKKNYQAKVSTSETTEEDLKRYVREADPPVDTSDLRTEEEPRRDINSMLDELCNGMM